MKRKYIKLFMLACFVPLYSFAQVSGNFDSSFLESCRLHMGEHYKQYVVKNILKVHNRNHPNKRHYVKDEDQSKNTHSKRATRNWYKEFSKVSKGNLNKLYYSQEPFNKKDFKK